MTRQDTRARTAIGGTSTAAWRCFACGRKLAVVQVEVSDTAPEAAGRVEIACPRCGRTSAFSLLTGAPIGPTRRSHSATRRRQRGAEPREGPAVSNLENIRGLPDPQGVCSEARRLDSDRHGADRGGHADQRDR